MTQKELLYIEDDISHEQIIIEVLVETINCLEDESLCTFLKKELKSHRDTKDSIMKFLKECAK